MGEALISFSDSQMLSPLSSADSSRQDMVLSQVPITRVVAASLSGANWNLNPYPFL